MPARLLPILLAWLLLAGPVQGELRLSLEMDDLSGPGWRAEGVSLVLDKQGLTGAAARLKADAIPFVLENLSLDCPRPGFVPPGCPAGRLTLGAPAALRGAVALAFLPDGLRLALAGLNLAAGRLDLTAAFPTGGWRLDLEGRGLMLDPLLSLADPLLPVSLHRQSTAGILDLSAHLEQAGDLQGNLRLTGRGVGLSTAQGLYAAQGVDLEWVGAIHGPKVAGRLHLTRGELYLDPLPVTVPPGGLLLAGGLGFKDRTLTLEGLQFNHPQVLDGTVDGVIGLAGQGLSRLELTLRGAVLPEAYRRYLQPFWLGTTLGELETTGALKGGFRWRDGRLSALEVILAGVDLADGQGRFAVTDLEGGVGWGVDGDHYLSWSAARVYRLDLGAARFDLRSRGDDLLLESTARIPLLDGAVLLEQLELEDLAATPGVALAARLEPVSMKSLSQALDWPPLAGKLSGTIPGIHYRQGRVDLLGALVVQIFGGDVVLTDLHLEDPFGVVPRLYADLTIRDLNLETLTGTFDFGRITGRLEGKVRDLVLTDWRPTAFDGVLGTPPGDDTPHRI
ncbi:MAG: hypothetical protein R3310_11920, partial [Candidatus Competibacteraceae bacterium]|nr:hypothetical protein [Candidatus Competibacteraceae bacterium]